MSADPVESKLARWAERDAAIGLAAELEQAHVQLSDRDRELAHLRERNVQLGHRLTQVSAERDALQHQVVALARPSIVRRALGKARRTAARVLPR